MIPPFLLPLFPVPPLQPRPARRQLFNQHDHLLLAQPHLQGAPGQDGRVSSELQ